MNPNWLLRGMFGAATVLLVATGSMLVSPRADAFPGYLNAWQQRYPNSTIPQRMQNLFGLECYTCHHPAGFDVEATCYRLDIREKLNQGLTIEQALQAVENMDSDGDGVSNLDEIMTARTDQPGQVGYHPGLIGATGTSPCGPTPNDPVTNQPETPGGPQCRADFNDDGSVNSQDFFDFLSCFFTPACINGDFNRDGAVNSQDFFDFLTEFFAGC